MKLRSLVYDQPQRPLERAVWWTEHVLRHGGAKHLRSPAANMSWPQYLELKLVAIILSIAVVILITIVIVITKLIRRIYTFTYFTAKFKKY